MPWCPKCRSEYREGFTVCNDCKAELVENVEKLEPNFNEILKDIDSEEYLMTVDGDMQANVIGELLNSNKIPVLKKYREAGEHPEASVESTKYEVDLYVPSSLGDMAKRVIDESSIVEEQDMENPIDTVEGEKVEHGNDAREKNAIKPWMVLLIIIIVLVLIWMYMAFNK